jgi:hypothetical protein
VTAGVKQILQRLDFMQKMIMKQKLMPIWEELKNHSPFTLFGALTGIICMIVFRNLQHATSLKVFYVFHPSHVLLSAIVTTSIFQHYARMRKFLVVFLIGFVGSIGIGTLSDSLIPYVGELSLGMHINVHAHEHAGFAEQAHIGFIEAWYIVIPAAIVGVMIGYFRPKTKFPHAGHVLLSMWASSFHMLMAMGAEFSAWKIAGSFVFLFIAVIVPCCFSDIVFPLLFVKSGEHLPHCHH